MVRLCTVICQRLSLNIESNTEYHVILFAGMRGKALDFNQRLEIAIDVAHGLTYLHLYAGSDYCSTYILFSNIFFFLQTNCKIVLHDILHNYSINRCFEILSLWKNALSRVSCVVCLLKQH